MLLYLAEPGASLSVRAGRLIADDQVFMPRDHALSTIILAATGYVTTDALAWVSREHVGLMIVHEGEFLALASTEAGCLARKELAVRRKQMECVLDPVRRVEAACAIVAAKIGTLQLPPEIRQKAIAGLSGAGSIEDAMVIEAEAGAAYWRALQGRKLTFKGENDAAFTARAKAAREAGLPEPQRRGEVPAKWLTFDTRARPWRTGRLGETGKQFSNRFALHPLNAMLNYAGAIVVAQCARACAGLGLDVGFGVLHSTRPGMVALAWDVYELLRVRTEEAVFGFAGSRRFEAREFKIVREPKPHVRFEKQVGRELAAWIIKAVPFSSIVKTCRSVMELF